MFDHSLDATVLDTDNLHFSEEFLEFPVQVDTDICMDALGFSARYRAEESRQEFRADSCGKWQKQVACEAEAVLLQLQIYTYV